MQPPEQNYSLEDYVAAVKRRRRIFFFVALPIITIASIFALVLPDEYRSAARIAIDLQGANVRTLEPMQVSTYADQYVAELRDRVLHRDNLLPLVQDTDVFTESEDELSIGSRLSIINRGFFFGLVTQPVMSDRGREVDIITGFRAGFEDEDPDFAHKVATFIAESFLREDRAKRTAQASSTSAFLGRQIAETEEQIAAYEQQVADFKVNNACCLPELRDLNMSVIQRTQSDIEALQPQIRTLEQNRQFLQAQLEEIRQQSAATDRLDLLEQEYLRLVANYGADHPDVIRVRREIQAITEFGSAGGGELQMLRIELAEAQRKYSDIHPDVVSLKRRIEALEGEQPSSEQAEQGRLIENPRYLQLRAQINAANTDLSEISRRIPELREKIDDYENRLARTPQVESEYQALNRKLQSARDTFDDIQRRLSTAQQTEALESTEIGARLREVQAANLPNEPSGPPRVAFFMIGAFLAGSLAIGATILAEMLDSTIRGSKDISRVMEALPIATVPVIQNSLTRVFSRRQLLVVTSAFLVLAIGIAYLLAGVAA